MLLHVMSAALLVIQVGCWPVQKTAQHQPALVSDQQKREIPMPDDSLRVLQTSQDPKELVAAARSLARSKQSTDHDLLLHLLQSEDFLMRLDSESDYRNTRKRLRIGQVTEALSKNDNPTAHKVLVALTQSPMFIKDEARADLLIQACAAVRPAPPEVVRFWNDHSKPDDGFTHLTIQAVVENGTAPALRVLEQKMADPAHTEDDKISWMRSTILTHRDDLPLLQSCERMLTSGLPKRLRPYLVEVLFDYRPAEWYAPAELLHPPDRKKASEVVLAQLRRIGQFALRTVALTPEQKEVVERSVKEIGKTP
jgi:hypothetical protein